jgi:hypothetical protein
MPITAVALPGRLMGPWTRLGVSAGKGILSESASFSAKQIRYGETPVSIILVIFTLSEGDNQDIFAFSEGEIFRQTAPLG